MKKILITLLATALILTGTLTAFADEGTRPSISISSPSERLIKENGTITYTITFADAHGEELTFNPSLITETFKYTERTVIKVKPNCYDIIYSGVNTSGISRIKVQKGGGIVRGLETYESPNSESFFVFDSNTSRKDIADYLLRIVGDDCLDKEPIFNDAPAKYNKLYYSAILLGTDTGSLLLQHKISEDEAYLINRRIDLLN